MMSCLTQIKRITNRQEKTCMIKVLCTTNSDYLKAIAPLINHEKDMRVIKNPDDNLVLKANIAASDPDVLLIDADVSPVEKVVYLIHSLRSAFRDLKLVAITLNYIDATFFPLIEAGADSILSKKNKREVIQSLRMIDQEQFILPSKLVFKVAAEIGRLKTHTMEKFATKLEQNDIYLTQRETDIAYLMRVGLKNKQIAEKLQLTNSSIKVYVSHIYRKIGNKNRWQVVKLLNTIFPVVENTKSKLEKYL